MYIQSNLRYLRKEKGFSYRRLSVLSHVPHTVIERIEKGITLDPSISTIVKLAKALDVGIEDFLHKNLENENVPVTGTK